MKALLLKLWNFLKQKNNLLITIVILLILGLGITVYFQRKKITDLKQKNEIEVHLKNALLDSVAVYQNKQKEWVAEKLTIQETIKNLQGMNKQLTASQQELLKRVEEVQKKNDIIAAALITTAVKVDSLLNISKYTVDTINKNITFADSTKFIKYNIQANHVVPAVVNVKPNLLIKTLEFPNKQFIEFHWRDNKKQGYPISFSVTNTNDYFKTINLDSYAIPDLVKPSSKFLQWISKNGKTALYVGGGVVVGGGIIYLLKK